MCLYFDNLLTNRYPSDEVLYQSVKRKLQWNTYKQDVLKEALVPLKEQTRRQDMKNAIIKDKTDTDIEDTEQMMKTLRHRSAHERRRTSEKLPVIIRSKDDNEIESLEERLCRNNRNNTRGYDIQSLLYRQGSVTYYRRKSAMKYN